MKKHFPPGPRDGMLGLRTLAKIKADVLGSYTALQRDYGDVVSMRSGPYRLFLFFHPDQVYETLVTHAKTIRRFPRVMQTFAQWNGNSILIAEDESWIRQRRLVQPAFHPRRFTAYGQTIVRCAQQLVDDWQASFDRTGHIDLDVDAAMTALTLRIICRTMFDSDVSDQSAAVADAVRELSEVAFFEMQAPIRLPIWVPTARNRRKRRAMQVLDQLVWRFVRQRRHEGRDHGDLLSMLLTAVDEDAGGARLNDRQVRDEAMTLMLAGHNTTAAGLDWLWYCLARFPDVAARCREEVNTVVGHRELSAVDVPQLPFLEATIKETLRLYPPAIGVFLRQAKSDLEVAGCRVPKGSLISLSTFVTQRDPRWFPQPLEFDPERFLAPRVEAIPPGAYFPFGAGPRACIGQPFAMTEMALIAATMLQRCEISLAPGSSEPQLHVHVALRPRDQLLLRCRPRSQP